MNKVLKLILRYDVIAIILAIAGLHIGLNYPTLAGQLSFIGEIFILLLKMLIIPLVVTSIFLSIATLNTKEIRSLGFFTVGYYFLTSALAGLTGLFVINQFSFGPDVGIFEMGNQVTNELANISFQSIVTSFFSGNFFEALTEGNIVQIVVFTIFLAVASLKVEYKFRVTLIELCEAIQEMMMVVINWVVKIAPIGVFSLVASLVAKTDKEVLHNLGALFQAIALAVAIHTLITLPVLAVFVGNFNPFKFYLKCKKALIVAFTTASSTATLPISAQVLKDHGEVKPKTAGFVLPLGATINMDGSALYQAMVVVFIGELAGIQLNFYQEFLVFVLVMTSSVGTSGIPAGGVMMIGAVMQMVGIDLSYIGVYLIIDRVWDYPITAVNVLGDLTGAKTIDRYVE